MGPGEEIRLQALLAARSETGRHSGVGQEGACQSFTA